MTQAILYYPTVVVPSKEWFVEKIPATYRIGTMLGHANRSWKRCFQFRLLNGLKVAKK